MPIPIVVPDPIEVEVCWYELAQAGTCGLLRNIEAYRDNRPNSHGLDDNKDWEIHINGAIGEMIVAKAFNLYWDGSINTFKTQPDVAGLQVRTRSKDEYELLVRPDDDNDKIFVHVTGKRFKYKVKGWKMGRDCKRKEWFKTFDRRPPAYFVPDYELHDIRTLPIEKNNSQESKNKMNNTQEFKKPDPDSQKVILPGF